jgi:prepilin-type processing-associated H-X9-DG protein
MTWLTRILPYVEQDTLWNATVQAFSKDPFMEYTPPHVGFGTPVKIFRCPADGRPGVRRPDYAREPTSYVGVAGTNQFKKDGLLYKDSRLKLADVLDGTSNTLLVGERPHDFSQPMFFGVWYGGTGSSDFGGTLNSVMGVRESGVLRFLNFPSPSCHDGPYSFAPGSIINPCSVFHYWSLHPGGANFLFADGSARLLPYSSSTIMPALATRAGGEVFGE